MNVLKSVREERAGMNGNKTAKNELKVPEQNQLSAEREKAFKNGFKFAKRQRRREKINFAFSLSPIDFGAQVVSKRSTNAKANVWQKQTPSRTNARKANAARAVSSAREPIHAPMPSV